LFIFSVSKLEMPKNNRTLRNNQNMPTDEELEAALMSVIIDKYDYQRMVEYKSNAIDVDKSYDEFLTFNKACLKAKSNDDKIRFLFMVKRTLSKKMMVMNMENAYAVTVTKFFFDLKKNHVHVTPR
jgi:hypothetical protein